MSASRSLIIVVIMVFHQATAFATDVSFMPGDAFFSSRLTRKQAVEYANANGPLLVNYASSPLYMGDLGGYCGFPLLQIHDPPAEWGQELKVIYTALRRMNPENKVLSYDEDGELVHDYEANPFWLFVYSRSFDFDNYRIGVKYNETWHDPLPEVKPPLFSAAVRQYIPFISKPDAVAEDWRECRNVAGLNVMLPDLGERHFKVSGPRIAEPISASAKDVRLVIFPNQDLDEYFLLKTDDDEAEHSRYGCRFIVLDADGVWNYRWDHEEKRFQIKPWTRELELKGWPQESENEDGADDESRN